MAKWNPAQQHNIYNIQLTSIQITSVYLKYNHTDQIKVQPVEYKYSHLCCQIDDFLIYQH